MNKLLTTMVLPLLVAPVNATVSLNDEYYPWNIIGAVEVCPTVLQLDAERDGEHIRFYHSIDGDIIESYRCAQELRRTGQGGMSPF